MFLRDGAVVLPIFTNICQLFCCTNIKTVYFFEETLKFSLDYKIAKLKPLYKKRSKTDQKNYRPASPLPLVSTVIEKVIRNQTENFLSKNKIVYKYQSGFHKSFSTNSNLIL